jgi:hypothetical protein
MQTDNDSNHDDELMRRLLAPLGPRQEPDQAALRRAEAAFREALAPVVLRGKRNRRRTWLSVAATVIVVVGTAAIFGTRPSDPADAGVIAQVVKSIGPVELIGGTATGQAAATVRTGQVLMTAANGRALLRYRGADVRLDVATTVRFDATRLVLQRGAIYVDSGDPSLRTEPPVLIETPFGMLGHIGTQFMARLDADHLTVGVREGSVFVKSGTERRDMAAPPHRASIAEVDRSGNIQIRDAKPFDGLWSWVPEASPGFAVEGSSVEAYLKWLSRENGYSVQYDGPASATQAKEIVLHGDLNGLSLADAIATVSATTQLDVELEPSGTVRVALEGDHDADPRHDGQ